MIRRSIASLIVLCIALAIDHRCCAASEKEIDVLIAKLVSPNKAPGKIDDVADADPPGFSEKAQDRVYEAWKQLYEMGLTVLCRNPLC
jgi:hypothetical protein